MATRKIVLYDDEILRKVCKPVTEFDGSLALLLDDLHETMIKNEGAGLAAPQVGIVKRVVTVTVGDEYYELVNPVIVSAKGKNRGVEGCLSFPKKYGYVTRPRIVTVRAQDRFGKTFEVKGEKMLARALCHEIDHLNGVLFVDKMEEEVKD